MSSSSSVAASPSSSSSPPLTPPSPLPVSVGPGHERYAFTPSPSQSPPFSPPAETTSPLLPERISRSEPRLLYYSAFSMDGFADREQPPCRPPRRRFDLGAWCFELVVMLVCCCCSSGTSKFEK